jgi:hypothetical protein
MSKNNSRYLGISIAEEIVSKAFPEAARMPPDHPKYDFIFPDGSHVDVKASCIVAQSTNSRRVVWQFIINKNRAADSFLLMAFDDRQSMNLRNVWLIPGSIINHRYGITLRDIDKWKPFKLQVDKFRSALDVLKASYGYLYIA